MDDKQRVTGIGGIFFKAKDPTGLARWYAEHLGIQVEAGESTEMVNAVFQDPPESPGMTVWALFAENTTYFGANHMMVNYRVADLDTLLCDLANEGVWIDPNRENHDYGKFAWIQDPEGNRIELWEPAGE